MLCCMLESTGKFIQMCITQLYGQSWILLCTQGFLSYLKTYNSKGIFFILFLTVLTKSSRIQYLLRMQNIAFLFQSPSVA